MPRRTLPTLLGAAALLLLTACAPATDEAAVCAAYHPLAADSLALRSEQALHGFVPGTDAPRPSVDTLAGLSAEATAAEGISGPLLRPLVERYNAPLHVAYELTADGLPPTLGEADLPSLDAVARYCVELLE